MNHLDVSKSAKQQETKEDKGGCERVTLGPQGESRRPQEEKNRGQKKKRFEGNKRTDKHPSPIRKDHRNEGTPEASDHIEISLAGGLSSPRRAAYCVSSDHLLYFCDLRD
jgi:hypothetical protein